MASTAPLRVALVGAGRVGTAVTLILDRSGFEVAGVSSRTKASQTAAARRLGCDEFDYRTGLPPTDVVLLGVGDEALEEVAELVALRIEGSTRVIHFSGSVGTRPLAPVVAAGGRALALHPVQACPDVDTAIARLPGAAWGVTGEGDDVEWAKRLISDALQGTPVRVGEEDRAAWHAAAVMVSNGIAALLAIGESMLAGIGVEPPEVVLGPIAAGTVQNAREGGGGAATLTGPVVRGEAHIIDRHLRALAGSDLSDRYARVVQMIVSAARAAGRIDAEAADEMSRKVDAR